ncbi:MAG: hypothetical protein HYU51_04170 [Candidatus Rokubacteria bacterium]|nr:hypothetical protein [Candidatus Rokubacteria bacterium]
MKMYVAGEWIDEPQKIEVRNPYDNSLIDTVSHADGGDVERALQSAERGARAMAKPSRWKWQLASTLRAVEVFDGNAKTLGLTPAVPAPARNQVIE